MPKPSFPDRTRVRHRAPITTVQRDTLRRVTAGMLAGVALVVTTLTLADVLAGWALLIAAAALLALPFATHGWGLLETVAPLPDVHTPVTGAALVTESPTAKVPAVRPTVDDDLLAVARAARVYGLHSQEAAGLSASATTAIPVVRS